MQGLCPGASRFSSPRTTKTHPLEQAPFLRETSRSKALLADTRLHGFPQLKHQVLSHGEA